MLKPQGEGIVFTPNAIRESVGAAYWKIRNLLFKDKIPKTDLHYGLISRRRFESMLKENNFKFSFCFADTTRPYLASIPLINNLLALNLIWKIKKYEV